MNDAQLSEEAIDKQVIQDILVRIGELRKVGWTRAAIARELDLSPDTLGKWKKGHRTPSLPMLYLEKLNNLVGKKPPKKKQYEAKLTANRAKKAKKLGSKGLTKPPSPPENKNILDVS
jgi:hypothetical protein